MNKILFYWKSISIRKKITSSFFLTALLGVFLITIYANVVSNKIIIQKAIADNLGYLNQFTEKLDSAFSHADSLTKLAIADYTIQENLTKDPDKMKSADNHLTKISIEMILSKLVENSNIISSMMIYTIFDDRAFISRGLQGFEIPSMEKRQAIANAFSNNQPYFWGNISRHSYKIHSKDAHGISLFRKLHSAKNGRLVAIIESVIREPDIVLLYENILSSQNGDIFICDADGTVLSSTDKSRLFSDISQSEIFKAVLQKRNSGKVISKSSGDYLAFNIYYPSLEWHIIGEIPIQNIRREIRLITWQIFLAGFFSVLISLLVAGKLSRSLTNPIFTLQKAISRSGQDLNVRVNVSSNDEIGDLAKEYNSMLDKQKGMMNRLLEEEKMLRKYELSLLQAQINPHFLYNALESICGLIDLDRKDDAHSLINEISRFYRGILSKGSSTITIREELQLTSHYINILNVRYNSKIEYRAEIKEELNDELIVKMTLQPLIENAIYHGLKNTPPPWKLNLKGYKEENHLVLELSDNGIGIEKEKESDSDFFGFGTKSTNERLKLYFGAESGLSIKRAGEGGTMVKIKIAQPMPKGIA